MKFEKLAKFADWATRNGWKITQADGGENLPTEITDRYDIPLEYRAFLRQFSLFTNAAENVWFLCVEEFLPKSEDEFRWNEFELISLAAADEGGETAIVDYWDRHFPIIMSVKNGYEYYAIHLESGRIVHGCEPEFEESTVVAENFLGFLEKIICGEIDDFADFTTKTELSTDIKIEYQNEQEKITSIEQLESRLSELREILTITNSKGVKCIGTVDVVVENLGRMSIALDERCILQFYDEVDDIYFNSLGDPLLVGDTADLYDFGQPSVSCEKYVVPYVVGLAALKGWLVSEKLGEEISWTEE